MTDPAVPAAPGRAFWIIGAAALVWNASGIATYLMSVTMSQEALAAMSDAERALYADIPGWVTGAYAIAVFGGTLASLALLLRRAWAVPLFALSLLGILVQMGHALLASDMLAVRGPGSAVLPVLIVVVAVVLLWFAGVMKRTGRLH